MMSKTNVVGNISEARMKRFLAITILVVCGFVLSGWGLGYGDEGGRDKGNKYADQKYQKDAEEIDRTQGNENVGKDLHSYISFDL